MYFSLFVIATIFSGINSLSVVNNISVPSDVFSVMFLDEIKLTPNKLYDPGYDSGQYNAEKCLRSLREIIKRYPSPDVASFFDAWGNIPSGVLVGNQYDLGNYDQCVKTSLNSNELKSVNYQYCFATLPLKQESSSGQSQNFWSPRHIINVGICVPDTCNPVLLTSIFKEAAKELYDGAFSEISVDRCSNGKIPQLSAANITGISILGVLTVLMVLSSIYDVYITHCKKKPSQVLLAFSILTNGKRLFAINTKRSRSSIDCLTGIRVLSTLWIMNHHAYTNILGSPIINYPDFYAWFFSWEFMPIYNASISVDTFFFMGGLLVAWIGFKELDKTNGKMNVLMNIVHRYFRLTPVLAAGLLLAYSVNRIVYTGPFKDVFMAKNNCDGHNWWPILLYIQNYYVQDTTCYDEAWYLAIDFQLYALSPLLLIPMWKWGKKFAPVLLVLGLISIAWIMEIYFSEGFTGLMLGANFHEWQKVYTPTHTRYAPWLIGFGFGYFMHKNRQTNFQLSKIVQLIGWIACFFTMTAVVFGPHFSLSANGKGTIFEAAMYESLKRVSWAIAQVWVTFACHYGFGGIVDTFLSHPFWQPLGRLTYALYMMHMAIMRMHFGMTRTQIYFSVYNELLYFWSGFGVTLFVAIYVTLAFESPVLILEKLIFTKEKPAKKENASEEPLPPSIFTVEELSQKNP